MTRFAGDLVGAVRALARVPLVPLITIGLVVLGAALTGQIFFVSLPLSLFETGWAGTQQIWTLGVEVDRPVSTDEVWLVTWRYVGRYFLLSLSYAPIMILLTYILIWRQDGLVFSDNIRYVFAGPLVLIEIALTFVVPALAFSTRSLRQAFRIGLRLLRRNWRRDFVYAIAPAVTLQSAYTFISPAFDASFAEQVAVGWLLALVALVLRVTIAREYVRLIDVDYEQPW